jgi:hypothetical protein
VASSRELLAAILMSVFGCIGGSDTFDSGCWVIRRNHRIISVPAAARAEREHAKAI